jgi:osmotically-inducible protein OsmY
MQIRSRRRFVTTMIFAGAVQAAILGAQAKPDNTATNKVDGSKAAVTADQQKNNRTDLETTRQIRRAVVADKTLSTYAHNVKIITRNGQVTLSGPVRTEAEKELVQQKAVAVAGATNVTSTLSVVPAKSSTPKQPS